MKIVHSDSGKTTIEELDGGSVFQYQGQLYLRIKQGHPVNAVQLSTGTAKWLFSDTKVQPVEAHVVVED